MEKFTRKSTTSTTTTRKPNIHERRRRMRRDTLKSLKQGNVVEKYLKNTPLPFVTINTFEIISKICDNYNSLFGDETPPNAELVLSVFSDICRNAGSEASVRGRKNDPTGESKQIVPTSVASPSASSDPDPDHPVPNPNPKPNSIAYSDFDSFSNDDPSAGSNPSPETTKMYGGDGKVPSSAAAEKNKNGENADVNKVKLDDYSYRLLKNFGYPVSYDDQEESRSRKAVVETSNDEGEEDAINDEKDTNFIRGQQQREGGTDDEQKKNPIEDRERGTDKKGQSRVEGEQSEAISLPAPAPAAAEEQQAPSKDEIIRTLETTQSLWEKRAVLPIVFSKFSVNETMDYEIPESMELLFPFVIKKEKITKSTLQKLKMAVTRYVNPKVLPEILDQSTEIEAILQPQISFVLRHVPRYLSCEAKSLESYLVQQKGKLRAVEFLQFVEEGEKGPALLRDIVVLNNVTGILSFVEENVALQFETERKEPFLAFSVPKDNFFVTSRFFAVSDFCNMMINFVASVSRFPRLNAATDRKLPDVPLFTDHLLAAMVLTLQAKYMKMTKKELFESVIRILHVFLYNMFLLVIATRLNILALASDKNVEMIGNLYEESKKYLDGLDLLTNAEAGNAEEVKHKKLFYYSVLLKYCYMALEHVVFALRLQVSDEQVIHKAEDFEKECAKWESRNEDEMEILNLYASSG